MSVPPARTVVAEPKDFIGGNQVLDDYTKEFERGDLIRCFGPAAVPFGTWPSSVTRSASNSAVNALFFMRAPLERDMRFYT